MHKGTATGVYNTLNFSGVFVGGAFGGLLHGAMAHGRIRVLCAGKFRLAITKFLWLATTTEEA